MVLIVEGFHVPLMLLLDVVGSAGGVAPWHKGPIVVNVGVTELLMTTLMVAVIAHPLDGVKV